MNRLQKLIQNAVHPPQHRIKSQVLDAVATGCEGCPFSQWVDSDSVAKELNLAAPEGTMLGTQQHAVYGIQHVQVAHAGGVLWADGTAHSLSRGLDVDHQVLYLREPDYLTPGVLLMRRQAFLDVGGLDARFGLGPYGDADLAMAMRQRGYQVCWRPGGQVPELQTLDQIETRCQWRGKRVNVKG